jgi:hypothetical protein
MRRSQKKSTSSGIAETSPVPEDEDEGKRVICSLRTPPGVLALPGVASSVYFFARAHKRLHSVSADAWDDWEDDVEDDDWDDEDDENHTKNRAVVMFDFLPKAEEVRARATMYHSGQV